MNKRRRRANALMMKYYSGIIDEGSWKTAAGDIAVFNTKYKRNLKSLVVQLEPIQSGSGDPSPDNIRPVSGRTGATVTRTGKNLLDANQSYNGTVNNSYYPEFFAQSPNADRRIGRYELKAGVTYTFSANIESNIATPFTLSIGCGQGTYQTDIANKYNQTNGRVFITFTPTQEQLETYGNILAFRTPRYPSAQTFEFTVSDIQLEMGATATEYVPYTGTTYPVSWETEAGTVCRGTVDVISGRLMVDMVGVDMGSLDWVYQSLSGNMYAENAAPNRKVYGRSNCSMFKYAGSNFAGVAELTVNNAYCFQFNLTNRVIVRDTAYTDATAFKSAVTGQRLVYELTAPQTYQLTPQQMQTLLGDNVIWSDAGPVSVEYWS